MHSAFATGLATPPRGSFAGDGHGGGLNSGSLFPVAEAGNTGELFGPGFGGGGGSGHVGAFSPYGGLGSVGSGLRVGATSPAFGRPPRDGSGPATAAASSLYNPTPPRAGSPAPGGVRAVGNGGGLSGGGGGLPPMYSCSVGMTSSGSAGNLFARGSGSDGGGSDGGMA